MPPRARWLAVLALLAFLANARSLGIGYLSDDWAIIGHLHRHGNAGHWTGPWLGLEHAFKIHRPLSTALYALELELFGAAPLPAHLHHLAWHVLAVLLVFAAATRLGASARGAFLAGLLFAVHPYLPATTGWLAGRASSVAGTLTLLTMVLWLRAREGGRSLPRALAVLAAAAAALTRETGYLALVLPLTLDLALGTPRPRWPGLVRRHAPFALAGVLLLVLRRHALGTLGGGYSTPGGLMAGPGAAAAALRGLDDALFRLCALVPPELAGAGGISAGASASGDERARWILPGATAAATLAMFVAGHLRRRERPPVTRPLLALAALFATQALVLLVSEPTLAVSTGQRWYTAIAWFAMALGVAATPLLARRGAIFALPLVAVAAFGHFRVQDALCRADGLAKELLARVEAAVEARPEGTEAVFLAGLPETQAGIPFVQWGLSSALRPPFRERPLPVPLYPVHLFMELGAPWPEWIFHPPVELMLAVRGAKPLALRYEQRGDATFALSASAVSDHGSAEAIAAFVRARFAAPPLRVLEPRTPRIEVAREAFRLPFRVDTEGLDRLEFFCFHEAVDMRYPWAVPPGAREQEVDLAAPLADFVLFHDDPAPLHVIPVGWRGPVPHLGPLFTIAVGR